MKFAALSALNLISFSKIEKSNVIKIFFNSYKCLRCYKRSCRDCERAFMSPLTREPTKTSIHRNVDTPMRSLILPSVVYIPEG